MKKIKLSKGAHVAAFDSNDEATMCVQEYASYLAGEAHSDTPSCVSPVLTAFMVPFNDSLDDEMRQRLRPYAVRQLGTKKDGQDEIRGYMALDWLIRTYIPAFLAAAGLIEEAEKLRGLARIDGLGHAEVSEPDVIAARDAAGDATEDATEDAAGDACDDVAWDAARDAAGAAAGAAAWGAFGNAAGVAGVAAWNAARAAAWNAGEDALRLTVEALRESAFELLDAMIDPGLIHDVPTEEACFEQTGREPLAHS